MLKRVWIDGYKSFEKCEVRLPKLAVLFGPNAAGKSNFLDALQLLSKLGTSRTLKEAFDPPCRGKPIESFTFAEDGLRGLLARDHLAFTLEADLYLPDSVVDSVNREIQEMRRPESDAAAGKTGGSISRIRERNLRYKVEVEMIPRSGVLRVKDEYLAALNTAGKPTGGRKPFIERIGDKIHRRLEGQAHPTYFDRYLDHTILSMPHYPPHHPHLVAARRELENWRFFYFEPRESMRAANPIKEVRHIGLMGEDLAAFLWTLKAHKPKQFGALEKSLHMLMPNIEGIELDVNDLGEVEMRLNENGIFKPARILSEGTLRMLGLLALAGVEEGPSLVGFEEPENGVHPSRLELIADLLKTRTDPAGETQYIVTTHSLGLPDLLPDDTLFTVRRVGRSTRIEPFFPSLGPLGKKSKIDDALQGGEKSLPVLHRILRGDFGA